MEFGCQLEFFCAFTRVILVQIRTSNTWEKTFWSRLMAKSSQIQWENKNYHVSLFLCAWAIVEITYFANSYKSVIHNDTTRKKGAKITIVAHKIQ